MAPSVVCWKDDALMKGSVPLLGFSANFYAPRVRLIVEIEGGYHERRASADTGRDSKLSRAGYRIVRVEAELLMRDLEAAVAKIVATIQRGSADHCDHSARIG